MIMNSITDLLFMQGVEGEGRKKSENQNFQLAPGSELRRLCSKASTDRPMELCVLFLILNDGLKIVVLL